MTTPSRKIREKYSQKLYRKNYDIFCQCRSKLSITAMKWKEKYDAVVVDCDIVTTACVSVNKSHKKKIQLDSHFPLGLI